MPRRAGTASVLGLAILGSTFSFGGWVIAIVPAFHDLKHIAVVVALAVVGFGLVLIPAGIDIFGPEPADEKGGIGPELISMVPGAVLFLITIFVVPTNGGIKAAAAVVEAIGIFAYARAWWLVHRPSNEGQSRPGFRLAR